MKWKVIGWTDWLTDEYEEGEQSWAIIHAIEDEVKRKGYRFTGQDHQEDFNCVPVMNSGKKICFTRRGWGRLMADVLGYYGKFDYSLYSDRMGLNYNRDNFPSDFADDDDIVKDLSTLNESFFIEIDEEQMKLAEKNNKIEIPYTDYLRYIDENDTLEMKCGDISIKKTVANVDKERSFSEDGAMPKPSLIIYFKQKNLN